MEIHILWRTQLKKQHFAWLIKYSNVYQHFEYPFLYTFIHLYDTYYTFAYLQFAINALILPSFLGYFISKLARTIPGTLHLPSKRILNLLKN